MGTMLAMMMIVAPPSHREVSYFEARNEAVIRSFLVFKTAQPVEREQNLVQEARDRDQLLLGGRAQNLQSGALGSFTTTCAFTASSQLAIGSTSPLSPTSSR